MRQISTTFIFMIATLAIGIVLLLIIFQFRIFGTGFCLGACEGAPCMLVDEDCHMNLDAEAAAKLIEQL